MKLDFSGERVLAAVAHPDDAELLCAGTLARARQDGAAIGICVLCRGEKGQPAQEIDDLAAVRRREMDDAASVLGVQLLVAEVPDGTLSDDAGTRPLVTELFRRFRPTLVLAHSPGDYHPDHRAASALAETASWFCASHGQRTESPPLEQPPALWWMDHVSTSGFEPEFFVDVGRHAQLKERMLACHRSQLARSGDRDFGPLLDVMRQQMRTRGAQAGVEAAEAFQCYRAFKRTRAW